MDKKIKILIKFSLGVYLLLLIWILFLFEGAGFSRTSTETFETEVNWIPFQNISHIWNLAFQHQFGNGTLFFLIGNLVGNILLFLPLGIFIPYFFSTHWKQHLIFGLLICFIIESIQYIFQLGVFDIDDILLNFLGINIGLGISRMLGM